MPMIYQYNRFGGYCQIGVGMDCGMLAEIWGTWTENVSFCGGNAAELWWGLKRIDRYFLLNNQGVTGKIKSDVL